MHTCCQKTSSSTRHTTTVPLGCLGADITFDGVSASTNGTSPLAPLFFNNLGCIHHKLKKHSTASFYFNRALKENDSTYSTSLNNNNNDEHKKSPSVDLHSRDRKIEMLYNLGHQLLITGKPDLAFQSFQEVALLYYKSPAVWLRLGESCVAAHVLKVFIYLF